VGWRLAGHTFIQILHPVDATVSGIKCHTFRSQASLLDGGFLSDGYLAVRFQLRMDPNHPRRDFVTSWAQARGFDASHWPATTETEAYYDRLIALLSFVETHAGGVSADGSGPFDAALFETFFQQAKDRMHLVTTRPSFASLEPCILCRMLRANAQFASQLTSHLDGWLAPWVTGRAPSQLAMVLEEAPLSSLSLGQVKALLEPGGALHAVRTEPCILRALRPSLEGTLLGKRPRVEEVGPPDELLCPITYCLMEKPVLCVGDGHT
jgi:hypothetical protein